MNKDKETFCRICEPFCPMLTEVDDHGKAVKLKPNPDHPCGGIPCNKGLSWLQVHNDPDRLNYPLKRKNSRAEEEGDYERISWEQSFKEVGEKLRSVKEKYGPDSVAVYFGNPIGFNSRALLLIDSLRKHIPTRMFFNPISQDFSNKSYGAGVIYGSPSLWMAPDLYHTDYLLLLGSNPKVSHWTLVSVPNDNGETLKNIKRRGGKVRFVNPRKIESSTSETGDTLRIKPGTDVYFLAALLNEIIALQGDAEKIVNQYGKNTQGLMDFVKRYRADRVSTVTGIEAETIRTVAQEILSAKSAAVFTATGVNQGRQGLLAYWLAEMINFVTGNLGREGGTYLPDGFCRFDEPLPEQEDAIDTSTGRWALGHNYNPLPTTVLPELINNGDIRALVMVFGNPLLSTPAEDKLRKAFEKLEIMVATDINRTDTVEMCDYVLPATDWLEREDINFFASGAQLRPYVQYTEAIVKPKAERRDDWWIIAKIAQEFGPSELFDAELQADGFSTFNQLLASRDLSIETLRNLPHQTVMIEQSPKGEVFDKILFHKDKKIDCCPPAFIEADLFSRCESIFQELESESPDVLKLISMRTIHMHNGWLANSPMLRKGILAENPLNMCEQDAAQRGLFNGDAIRVHNQYGSLQTQVLINNDLRPGAVAMSHGFGHKKAFALKVASAKPGVNYNRLVPTGADTHEPLSYMCWMTGVPVSVEKVSA